MIGLLNRFLAIESMFDRIWNNTVQTKPSWKVQSRQEIPELIQPN